MREIVIANLRKRFTAYEEWLANLDAEQLTHKLDVDKHKSLTEHLWCIVGARESYSNAIAEGSWQGFACSMTTFSPEDIREKQATSSAQVLQTISQVADWTTEREELLAALAEHEVMHEGQIIRHVYATQGTLPESWRWA